MYEAIGGIRISIQPKQLEKVALFFAVSRQMVLFAVERRKAWRMLQSKAGVTNKDYLAQKAFIAKLDKGEVPLADARGRTKDLIAAELAALK